MKRSRRLIPFLLLIPLALGLVLSGCASASPTPSPTPTPVPDPYKDEIAKGPVELSVVMLGDAPAGQPQVLAKINEKMTVDIKATMSIINIAWADWSTKYQLMFTAGDEFDAAFVTSWAGYSDLAKKGGFYEVSESDFTTYLPNTAPQLTDATHKYLWDKSAIDGKKYIIPQIWDWLNPYVVIVRGDLREKYGIAPLKTYDDFLNYLITIGNKEPGIIPYNDMGTSDKMFWGLGGKNGWTGMGDALAVDTKLNDGKVFDILERPETLAWALKNREVQLAGGFSKDVLSSKIDAATSFKNGTGAGYIDGFGGPIGMYMDVMKSNPEWKPEIIDIQGGQVLTGSTPFDGGLAVHATSKNPKRTLMMIDLLEGVKGYNDLLGLGIEGTHWTAVGDKKYDELSEGSNNYPAYNICPWGLNTNFMRSNSATPDWVATMRAQWVTQIGHPATEGFVFDNTKVADKIAAVSGIAKPEMFALLFGLKEDPTAALAELDAKLKAAGLDDIKAEIQTQLTAYIASSK